MMMKKKYLLSLIILFCHSLKSHAFYENDRYLERAKRKMNEGKYVEAIDALKKASERDENNAEIYYLMSNCYKKNKNYKEAARYFTYAKALEGRKENILLEGAVRIVKLF